MYIIVIVSLKIQSLCLLSWNVASFYSTFWRFFWIFAVGTLAFFCKIVCFDISIFSIAILENKSSVIWTIFCLKLWEPTVCLINYKSLKNQMISEGNRSITIIVYICLQGKLSFIWNVLDHCYNFGKSPSS